MSRRAAFPESELRRWARIAREEGVAIRGTRGVDGSISVIMQAANDTAKADAGDLDDRIGAFK